EERPGKSTKRAGTTTKRSPGGARRPQALADKLAKLHEGKVMDITKYERGGAGAKSINEPGENARSKIVIPGTRLVASAGGQTWRNVEAAAKDLGDDTLVERYREASRAFLSRGKSGGEKRSRSRPKKAEESHEE